MGFSADITFLARNLRFGLFSTQWMESVINNSLRCASRKCFSTFPHRPSRKHHFSPNSPKHLLVSYCRRSGNPKQYSFGPVNLETDFIYDLTTTILFSSMVYFKCGKVSENQQVRRLVQVPLQEAAQTSKEQ